MNSNLRDLFINSEAILKMLKDNKIGVTPYKFKDVKINTSSKSKIKTIGRRDK